MGIEGFFKTIEKKKNAGIKSDFASKTDTECLYIDFNSILYIITAEVEEELGILLCKIIYDSKFTDDKQCIAIAKKYDYDLLTGSIETYKKKFKNNDVEMNIKIINLVKKQLEKMLVTFTNETIIKKIFLAFDGVPLMGKVVEQKHRRYMGYVTGELHKKIYNKYQSSLSDKRKIIEENRYKYDRGQIVTWGDFMQKLEHSLTDTSWLLYLRTKYKSLEEIIVSGVKYPGEGEKKICEEIIKAMEKKENIHFLITSPDADIIVLAIILTNINKIKSFNKIIDVLHFSPDTKTYEYIKIDEFISYVCEYMIKDIPSKKRIILDENIKITLSNDFVLIGTLFGNDFLPKIQSINVKTDFELLLDIYKDQFTENGTLNALIFFSQQNKNMFGIDFNNLITYFNNLSKIEPDLIKHKYLTQNYDIMRIRKIIGYDRNNIDQVNFVSNYVTNFKLLLSKLRESNGNINNVLEYFDKNNPDFLRLFDIFDGRNKNNRIKPMTKLMNANYNVNPLNNLRKPNPRNGNIEEYQIDRYRDNKVYDYLIKKENNKLTQYDIEMIKFEWKLGSYGVMLNSFITDKDDVNFGNIINDKYHVNDKSYSDIYNRIYMKITTKAQLDDKVKDYIYGLIWVFDQYFNKNDEQYNMDNVSTWFYSSERAPLINDISNIFKIFIDDITNIDINEYNVMRKEYINRMEHLLYIVPYNKLLKDPIIDSLNIYKKLILDNKILFPDLDKQITEIWLGNKEKEYIDCKRITFITKCILEQVKNTSFTNFMKIVEPLRIYLSETDLDNVQKQNVIVHVGGNNYNELYHMYKKAYIELIN